MTWRFEWGEVGRGRAVHEPTGACFNVSRSGRMGVNESAGLCEVILATLMDELRQELRRHVLIEAPPSRRIH